MHVFYLHGFASSPDSSKAVFLAAKFAETGITLHCPDFNQPDFSTLTISRMLQQLETLIAALPPGEVVLIGSSLGAFVAVEAARRVESRAHPISRLVLLAPAVALEWETFPDVGPGGIDRWRRNGQIEVFHYAHDRPYPLNFSFYEDAIRYHPELAQLALPMLIFQGRRDTSVDPPSVERFAHAQPSATLHLVDDEHQLKESLDLIWSETARFLNLAPEP